MKLGSLFSPSSLYFNVIKNDLNVNVNPADGSSNTYFIIKAITTNLFNVVIGDISCIPRSHCPGTPIYLGLAIVTSGFGLTTSNVPLRRPRFDSKRDPCPKLSIFYACLSVF